MHQTTDKLLSPQRWFKGGMSDISKRVREKMREYGWTHGGRENVSELERRTELSYGALNELVRGKTDSPDLETIRQVAAALKVSLDWLVLGDDTHPSVEDAQVKAIRLQLIGKVANGSLDEEALNRIRDMLESDDAATRPPSSQGAPKEGDAPKTPAEETPPGKGDSEEDDPKKTGTEND